MKAKVIISLLVIFAAAAAWLLSQESAKKQHGNAAYDHTAEILACGPRPPESEGLDKAQAYITREMAKYGWKTVKHSVVRDTPLGKKTFTNLIARYGDHELTHSDDLKNLPATLILGAHLDSKLIPELPDFLGADDAASACALIVELGNTLAKENPAMAKQLEIVFFDGEESFNENMSLESGDGLYGSRAYAIELYKRATKPKHGIILDMVGHKDLDIAIPIDSPKDLAAMMMAAVDKYGYQKHFGMAKGGILDDHYYLNKAGVPTIDIIGDFQHSHWWHEEGDDMDLISADSLNMSYDVAMAMLKELLQ